MSTLMYKSGTSWIDVIHPVSSMWLSNSSTSPSSLFGGTWQQLTNAVLRAAAAYGYNGSDSMTLTVSNMPSHEHRLLGNYTYDSAGAGNDALWYIGHKTNTNKWTTSFCEATGGASVFKASPLLQHLLLGQNWLMAARGCYNGTPLL